MYLSKVKVQFTPNLFSSFENCLQSSAGPGFPARFKGSAIGAPDIGSSSSPRVCLNTSSFLFWMFLLFEPLELLRTTGGGDFVSPASKAGSIGTSGNGEGEGSSIRVQI